jgi:hypothetical protein
VDPAGRPDPSTGNGFRRFLYVAIGAAVLALALGVVGLGVLASDPRSGEMLSAAGRFFSATVEGQFTPAADALRDAGCQQAFVIPAGDARDFVAAFGGDADADAELREGLFVQCRTIVSAGDDACATMARVAAGASDPVPAQLIVNVDGFGGCRGLYAADGTLIRSLDP